MAENQAVTIGGTKVWKSETQAGDIVKVFNGYIKQLTEAEGPSSWLLKDDTS